MVEDSIGSAKPPRPPKPAKPHDPERTRRLLLQVTAVAAVAAAVFTGITAWQTYEHRVMEKQLYCTAYASETDSGDDEYDREQRELRDALGC